MPQEKLKQLKEHLQKSQPDVDWGSDFEKFYSEKKNLAQLQQHLKATEPDVDWGDDFVDFYGAPDSSKQQPSPTQPNQVQPDAPPQDNQVQENIVSVGNLKFDSNKSKTLGTDANGMPILEVTTNDNVAHKVKRKSDGSYDFFQDGVDVINPIATKKGGVAPVKYVDKTANVFDLRNPFATKTNYGEIDGKKFNSDSGVNIGKDFEGNDVYRVKVADSGEEVDVIRRENGTYKKYNPEVDKVAAQISDVTSAIQDKMDTDRQSGKLPPQIGQDTSDRDAVQLATSVTEKAQKQQVAETKKAAEYLVNIQKGIPADEVELNKLNAEQKDALEKKGWRDYTDVKGGYGFTEAIKDATGIESHKLNQDDVSVAKFEFQKNANNQAANALNFAATQMQSGLKSKYGERFDQYLEYVTKAGPEDKKQFDDLTAKIQAAKSAGDEESFNNLVKQQNELAAHSSEIQSQFEDITADPMMGMLSQSIDAINKSQDRVKTLLSDNKFKNAKLALDQEKRRYESREFNARDKYREIDRKWNSGVLGAAEAITMKGYDALSSAPRIVAGSVAELPKGVLFATESALNLIGANDVNKVSWLDSMTSTYNNVLKDFDKSGDVSDVFKNTNTYAVMKGLADLAPQVGLAYLTAGVGNAIGATANAGLKLAGIAEFAAAEGGLAAKASEMALQGVSNWAFAGQDVYNANLESLKDVEGLTPQEKAAAAYKLTFMQQFAVGAAGSLFESGFESVMHRTGIADGALGRFFNVENQLTQAEMAQVMKKQAALLTKGQIKDYVNNTGKDIMEMLTAKWRGKASNLFKEAIKSGVVKVGKSGAGESLEEFVFEPAFQYVSEQAYGTFGGNIDIQEMYRKAEKDDEEARKQSGRSQVDDWLSVFAVGAIASASGQILHRNSFENEQYNSAIMTALKDMPQFQKQMTLFKENQLKGIDPASQEYKTKKQTLDKMESTAMENIALISGAQSGIGTIASSYDVLVKQVGEENESALVSLLAKKAFAIQEAKALKLDPISEEARRKQEANSKNEDGTPKKLPPSEYDKKLAQVHAIDMAIQSMVENKSKPTFSEAFSNWIGGDKKTDTANQDRSKNISELANNGELTVNDIKDTDTYKNMSLDERNEVQAKLDSAESKDEQVRLSKLIEKEYTSKSIESNRVAADNAPMDAETAIHNTNIRSKSTSGQTKDDSNNIAFNKNSDYAYVSEGDAEKIKNGEAVTGLKYNKGSSKSSTESGKTNFVVERVKDENGNIKNRIFEKNTDGSYTVVHDEIGTKATLNENDKNVIAKSRYYNAQLKADNKRDAIIKEVNGNSQNLNDEKTMQALRNNTEYQNLVKEAERLNPKKSVYEEMIHGIKKLTTSKNKKASKAEVERKVKEAVDTKINEMERSNQIVKEGCD